jgi:PD-(D/E)XK nuclease superfamily protein
LTLRLSNSEMATFRRCRRKWYLSQYRRLSPRASYSFGTPIHIGNVVHDALAAYYDPELRTDPVAHARAYVDGVIHDDPAHEYEAEKEWTLIEPMLTGYVEWLEETGADSDLKFIGSERMVEAQMTENVTLISKLDAPVEQISDGAKLALEHKTVGSLEEPLGLLKIDTQLLTEHLVRFMDAQAKGADADEAYDQCHGVLYNMLKKNKHTSRAKPPFYGRLTIPHNIYELRNHWKHVLETAREISKATVRLDANEDHHRVCPPSPDKTCQWQCQFFKVCGMFDDGSQVEAALDAMYEEKDPLERYQGAEKL